MSMRLSNTAGEPHLPQPKQDDADRRSLEVARQILESLKAEAAAGTPVDKQLLRSMEERLHRLMREEKN